MLFYKQLPNFVTFIELFDGRAHLFGKILFMQEEHCTRRHESHQSKRCLCLPVASLIFCDLHTLDYLVVEHRKCGLSMKGKQDQERGNESLHCRRALNSVLLVYNKLKGWKERIIVQLFTIAMKGRQEGTRVIVVESSLKSGTSAETNEGICEN